MPSMPKLSVVLAAALAAIVLISSQAGTVYAMEQCDDQDWGYIDMCIAIDDKSKCIRRGCGWCGPKGHFKCEPNIRCAVKDVPEDGLAVFFYPDKCSTVAPYTESRSSEGEVNARTLGKPLSEEDKARVTAAITAMASSH